MENKLGANAVYGQRSNITTNRCEGSHLTILKSVPKNRTYRRNFAGRAHSANHSISIGETQSVVAANKYLGAKNSCSSPANESRRREIVKEWYHKIRKRSLRFKTAKRLCAKRKQRLHGRTINTGYATGCQDPIVRIDHAYDKTTRV